MTRTLASGRPCGVGDDAGDLDALALGVAGRERRRAAARRDEQQHERVPDRRRAGGARGFWIG